MTGDSLYHMVRLHLLSELCGLPTPLALSRYSSSTLHTMGFCVSCTLLASASVMCCISCVVRGGFYRIRGCNVIVVRGHIVFVVRGSLASLACMAFALSPSSHCLSISGFPVFLFLFWVIFGQKLGKLYAPY